LDHEHHHHPSQDPNPAAADDPDRRLGVKTKGCSGMSYDMSWTDQPAPTDEIVKDKDLTVLVDRKASLFLIGTVMDYEVKNLTAGFTFTNPNEKGRCGCGESFHV
jgi:iron-sulfur cluster assembly protein